MKGIILAAGKGTRLYPITSVVPKPLVPVYDKPMIYYPISTMLDIGIKDILLIVDLANRDRYSSLANYFNSMLHTNIKVTVQQIPRGIADAFIIGEEFIGDDSVCLVLGDNLFMTKEPLFTKDTLDNFTQGAMIGALEVHDPERFGVIEFSESGEVLSIEEKPTNPKSQFIVPGIYIYDNSVVQIAKEVKPSSRGEIEITSINLAYLELSKLVATKLANTDWFDTGTTSSLVDASNYIQDFSGYLDTYLVGYPEVSAHRSNLISTTEYNDLLNHRNYSGTDYYKSLASYLNKIN